MLDEEFDDLKKTVASDSNTYTFGRIGQHNVVIACLPQGGTESAATVAANLLASFPSIRFGLLVGVGGGKYRLCRYSEFTASQLHVNTYRHLLCMKHDQGDGFRRGTMALTSCYRRSICGPRYSTWGCRS